MFLLPACSYRLTRVMSKGELAISGFTEKIEVETDKGVLIMPVSIRGKTYRFIFDTGAPFGISEQLQEELGFKVKAKSTITDSDGNSGVADIVQVDTAFIGSVPFTGQPAFVLNLEAHPVLRCMNVDGFVGSSLIRHCNWKIDIGKKQITLSDDAGPIISESIVSVPFKTDFQYNIYVDMEMDTLKLRHLTLDYGSNGYLSLPGHILDVINTHELLDTSYMVQGYSQSGIVGKKNKASRQVSYTDKLKIGGLAIDSIFLKSGYSALIGTGILSRYIVTIDWHGQSLFLQPDDSARINMKTYGMSIGFSDDQGMYIQSVTDGSPAHEQGLAPDMQILRMDTTDYGSESNYCDILNNFRWPDDSLTLEIRDTSGNMKVLMLKRRLLGFSAQ